MRRDLATLLVDALALKELARAGWVRAGVAAPESVAAHSWGVAWLAFLLCPPGLDRGRAVGMAIVHDLAEIHTGDVTPHDGVSAATKRAAEERALEAWLAGLEVAAGAAALWREYAAGETAEARFVRACDKLDMGLQALRYRSEGTREVEELLESARTALAGSPLADLLADPAPE